MKRIILPILILLLNVFSYANSDLGSNYETNPNCYDTNYPDIEIWATAGIDGGIPYINSITKTLSPGDDIQTAINNTSSGVILLKNGTYTITDQISLKSNIVLRGESKDGVKISVKKKDGTAILMESAVTNAGLEDLQIVFEYLSAPPVAYRSGFEDGGWCDECFQNDEPDCDGTLLRIDGNHNWVDNIELVNSGSDPVEIYGNHNTFSNSLVDNCYNKGGGGEGYFDLRGDYNLIAGSTVKLIRHFAIQQGAKYNVVIENHLEVDVNFHNKDEGHNLIERNEIIRPSWHTWGVFATGGIDYGHTPPGSDNVFVNNTTYDYREDRTEFSETNVIYTYTDYGEPTETNWDMPKCGTFYAVAPSSGMRNMTSTEIVADMGIGWNLGNTLDAHPGSETSWGNPYTTKAIIDKVRAKGFKTMRLPVTWYTHIGSAPNYTIDASWLDRVEEIMNYALDNDMYVILNIHHEEDDWLIPTYAQKDAVIAQITKLWTQIATHFKDYNDYLIFETMNEPRVKGSAEEWSGGTAEGRDCINQFHQTAVDAIRATGGNNTTRHLMLTTYGASTSNHALDALVIPNNDPNTIIALHTYFPWNFCGVNGQSTWGSDSDKAALDGELDKIYNKFIAIGKPVVMGEWGSKNYDNTAARTTHAEYYAQACVERGIVPVVWDDGGNFELLNRDNLTWRFPTIVDAIMSAQGEEEEEEENPPVEENDGTNFSPIHDAYLQGSTPYNTTQLKVEDGNRVSYLMFDLSTISDEITALQLKLTVNGDAGSGELNIHLGNNTTWTESSLTSSNAPGAGQLLGTINTTYSAGSTHNIDLDASTITAGKLSLVISQNGGNDVWFGSKESSTAPALIVTTQESNPSTPQDDNLIENSGFETGDFTGWTTAGTTTITNDAKSGSNASKIADAGQVYQIIELKANTSYTASCYAKVGTTGESVFFGVTNETTSTLVQSLKVESTSYALQSISFTTGNNVEDYKVWFWNNTGGEYFADDFKLIESVVTNQNNPNASTVNVFPNPFSQQLSVDLGNMKASSATLFDAQGQAVLSQEISTTQFELIMDHSLSQGMYYLQLIGDSEIQTIRIIKQ